jgi:hypothetical protein
MSHHIGRSFSGTRIEDACPCPKGPCGLVDSAKSVDQCEHHPMWRSKTIRQSHRAEDCPGMKEAA